MAHRIAIASSDGKYIDQHFGHAERFIIVDVTEEGYAVAETRASDPACRGFEHSESSFDAIIALLKDCEGVFVSRVGPSAAQYVLQHGLRVFEAPYFIEDVLDKLVRDGVLEQ